MTDQHNRTFDLVVLGGGSAGFAAAIKGDELGARVAMVEGGTLGGTCVNVGCIPSKRLLRAAEANHGRTQPAIAGIPAADGSVDWAQVRAQKDELVSALRGEKYEDVLASHPGAALIRGRASFISARSLRTSAGQVLAAERVIVAAGASPSVPAIHGLQDAGYLDSAGAMALDCLPKSLAVIGGGPVGVELGQMFARLGVVVMILEAQAGLLPREEPSLGEALAGGLRDDGIAVFTGAEIHRVTRGAGGRSIEFTAGGERRRVTVDEVLVATGRKPNTRGIGLDHAGVALGESGAVVVNEFLQTSSEVVYAAGDVVGDPMLVYIAAYAGNLAATNALRGNQRPYDLAAVPSVTFTDPAVATVGLTAAAARNRGIQPLVTRLPMEHVPRARVARDTRGFIQLVANAITRQIIGAQVVASEAGELMGEATLAVRVGLTIEQVTSTFHPYLTLSEGFKLAAQSFTTDVAKLSCCAA